MNRVRTLCRALPPGVFALAVLALWAPDRAEAGCEAYLKVLEGAHHADSPVPAPDVPCHGPHCSSSPTPEPTPRSLPLIDRSVPDEAADRPAGWLPPRPRSTFPPADPLIPADPSRDPPFHPPRPA